MSYSSMSFSWSYETVFMLNCTYPMYEFSLPKKLTCYENWHLKMLISEDVCNMLKLTSSRTNVCIQTLSVDPDQTAPKGAV